MSHSWRDLDRAFHALEERCTDVARGVITVLWEGVLERTPQYTGGMVESWTYSIGVPKAVDRSQDPDASTVPRWAGYRPNIEKANAHNLGADAGFKMGDRVFLTNGAPHAYAVNAGEVRLRPVNAAFGVERAMDLIKVRYGYGVTARQAGQLQRRRIGV